MTSRPVSACVITRNEETHLGPCLDALAFCDEIVVVDCGSTDRTVEVARGRGARVLEREWPGMIAQKNRAVEAARHDWVLCIDADERVTPPLASAIRRALATDGGVAAGYAFAWRTFFQGGPVRSDGGRARWKLRLYDRRRGRWTGRDPHGHVDVEGAVRRLAGTLEHHGTRDLAHWVSKLNDYTDAGSEELLETRRSPLFGMLVRAPWAFVRTYLLRGGFRDGTRGFVVAVQAWAYVFVRSAKLHERREARRAPPGEER